MPPWAPIPPMENCTYSNQISGPVDGFTSISLIPQQKFTSKQSILQLGSNYMFLIRLLVVIELVFYSSLKHLIYYY